MKWKYLPIWKKNRIRQYWVLAFLLCLLLSFSLLFASRYYGGSAAPFELLENDREDKLTWYFVTKSGSTFEEDLSLLPSEKELTELAGVPVQREVCTADKFLNLTAANAPMDVLTSCYTDSKLKRFETSGRVWNLELLAEKNLHGFNFSESFIEWCGNTKNDVYAYPHTKTVTEEDKSPSSGVAMLVQKEKKEEYFSASTTFGTKEAVVDALKVIRKNEPDMVPCYLDLTSLQQMFGARIEDEDGTWQEKFFEPETLEGLQYLNRLYRERMLPQELFTLTEGALLSQLREGKVFLVSTRDLYSILQCLPEDDLVWQNYEPAGPIRSDSGKIFQFRRNYDEQYASTMFFLGSSYESVQARLLIRFCVHNMDFTPVQQEALVRSGLSQWVKHLPRPEPEKDAFYTFAVPTIPYEILFSHYADTRLATIYDRTENYRSAQIIKMVLSSSPEEVKRIYSETLQEMKNGDYELLENWKENRYQKAKELAAPNQQETVPETAGSGEP